MKHLFSCFLDGRGGQVADRHKAVALKTMAWWDAIQPETTTCQSMQEWIPQVMFVFFENQTEKQMSFLMKRSLR